ncbi:CCR4-NOT transcription complex subunit 7 [Rhynchospora pubera]|uniref:poly(A)-specific ribonuclease n=1 Tax=Rhynchospora pubera TaxID=906938 RepID=A0AAV8HGR1_9POAL|nr:CCR4-NOT transcription complex subunit 7 [Rhynchospora pubera]
MMAVRRVWNHNLEHEFALLRDFARYCPYITIDTEFPGVVFESPMHPRHLSPEQRCHLVMKNVNCLKLIQLGLTLSTSDSDGGIFITWEFNFRGFNPLQDLNAPSSVELLKSQGLDFWANYYYGVDPQRFSALLWSSGLVCNPTKTWIGFHLAYDIAYLMKVLSGREFPDSMEAFLKLVRQYFGSRVYDIKYLCKLRGICGGLEKVGSILDVKRAAGQAHHAGSDSLLTWHTFRSMKANFFRTGIEAKHAGIIFGIQES